MAFSTQKKFPGYEPNVFDEINKMKSYDAIKDHRTWSMDNNQQANYLVEVIHKGEGDTTDSENHFFKHDLLLHRNQLRNDEKIFKQIGVNTTIEMPTDDENVFTSKIYELSLELEAIKSNNEILADENVNLKQRVSDIIEENEFEVDENDFHIIENIVTQRNDLMTLLEEVIGVTDNIFNLKAKVNDMQHIESENTFFQEKCKVHKIELDTLRKEKMIMEKRLLKYETNSQDIEMLKMANSKLEKDIQDLSNVISISKNFIQNQENDINIKMSTISELQDHIQNLKNSLAEAEFKLNKKLRLEKDVELMEEELSIMIENSAETVNPYNQLVIDRQVEDLATAIKLTLGHLNEIENEEDDNLKETNRQLTSLLLESSNKILEFKDVINKQESNLIKVTNDFACKNDELTECLATVEELKRQLASTKRNQKKARSNSKNVQNLLRSPNPNIYSPNDYDVLVDADEMAELDINLADLQQNSEYESDGQEIEALENIFEQSCGQLEPKSSQRNIVYLSNIENQDKLHQDALVEMQRKLRNVKEELTQVKNDFNSRREEIVQSIVTSLPTLLEMKMETENVSTNLKTSDQFVTQEKKIKQMASAIENLESKNDELKLQNRDLLAQIKETPVFETSNKKLDEMETELKKLQAENQNLRQKFNQNQNVCDVLPGSPKLKEKHDATDKNDHLQRELERDLELDVERDLERDRKLQNENEKLKIANKTLLAEIGDLKNAQNRICPNDFKLLQSRSLDHKGSSDWITNENKKLRISNEKLVAELDELKLAENRSQLSIMQMKNDMEKLGIINECLFEQLNDEKLEKTPYSSQEQVVEEMTPVVKHLLKKNEDLRIDNEKLSSEIRELKCAEHRAHSDALEKQNELEQLTSTNESLLAKINEVLQFADWKENHGNENISTGTSDQKNNLSNRSYSNVLKFKNDSEKLPSTNDIHKLEADIRRLQNENNNLKIANEHLIVDMKKFKNHSNINSLEQKDDVEKSSSTTDSLLAQERHQQPSPTSNLEADWMAVDMKKLQNKNEKLLSELTELRTKLKNIENRSHLNILGQKNNLEKSSSTPGRLFNQETQQKHLSVNAENVQNEWMMSVDVKKIQNKNEKLETENEKLETTNGDLLSEINELRRKLESAEKRLHLIPFEQKNYLEKSLSTPENLLPRYQQSRHSSRVQKVDTNWMAVDMKRLENKNESLNILDETDDSKYAINHSSLTTLRKEKFLKTSEGSLEQVIDLNLENKHTSEHSLARDIESNIENKTHSLSPDLQNLHKTNEKLRSANENLSIKIKELQNAEKRDLKKKSSSSDSPEMKQLSPTTGHREESDLLTTDSRQLQNNNEVLKTAEMKQLSSRSHHREESYLLMADWRKLQDNNDALKTVSDTEESEGASAKKYSSLLQMGKCLATSSEGSLPQVNDPKLAINSRTDLREMERQTLDVVSLQKKNEELKNANEKLSAKIRELQSTDYLAHDALKLKNDLIKLSATNESLLAEINELKQLSSTDPIEKSDYMTKGDLKKLQTENEKLKAANENLVAEISDLRSKFLSTENRPAIKCDSENLLATNEYPIAYEKDQQQQSSGNAPAIDSAWMPTDLKTLQNKNEKLKLENENLIVEIRELKNAEERAHRHTLQLERDLLKLSTMNERLSAQLNVQRRDKKSKSNEFDESSVAPAVKDLIKKNDELKMANENLVSEIEELKTNENLARRDALELQKLTATNKSLMAQIKELKLLSSNDYRMESDWMTTDAKKILNKNKKLKTSIEKFSLEVSQLRKELKASENRANLLEKKIESQPADVTKLQKKNEELKAANEKLLAIIVNLKNSEKLAKSKSLEFEIELKSLGETNKNLQDTLENFVERDSNNKKPNNELERLCQLILDEGMSALTDIELNYLYKCFSKSVSGELELKTARTKLTGRKHCKICHGGAMESLNKVCECKQYEEKKRLNLLKEIEETKLAIMHIQSSTDIEFDLNDVKNRLLKGKVSDVERIYEIKMNDSQKSINVRTHFNKSNR